MTKHLYTLLWAVTLIALVMSCSDPRTAPAVAPDAAHTESITLWENAPSNGQILEANFEVRDALIPMNELGSDVPARLGIAVYIQPDSDIDWYEKIVRDSIPGWTEEFVRYLVAIEVQDGILDTINGIRALCDSLPELCPDDTSQLMSREQAALELRATYQDSVDAAVTDTTRLGDNRDSLASVVDNRYTLALWMDDDTTTAYPNALADSSGRLYGQSFYLSPTNEETGMKGRGFQLDLDLFDGANFDRPGRPLEFNWTKCDPGSADPCMSVGPHTLRARATGAVTRITAALVLVYAEERP